jgi:hypothetical protein
MARNSVFTGLLSKPSGSREVRWQHARWWEFDKPEAQQRFEVVRVYKVRSGVLTFSSLQKLAKHPHGRRSYFPGLPPPLLYHRPFETE